MKKVMGEATIANNRPRVSIVAPMGHFFCCLFLIIFTC
jgi:hypothetical protein